MLTIADPFYPFITYKYCFVQLKWFAEYDGEVIAELNAFIRRDDGTAAPTNAVEAIILRAHAWMRSNVELVEEVA